MTIPVKTLKNGLSLPALGFGTWGMGGRFEREAGYDESRDIAAIRKTVEMGGMRFDSAEMYAAGYSEEILGRALKGFDRSKLFITTKVSKEHLRHDDLINSCRASLKRLQTDYLDLYLIHFPNPEIDIKETMRAMDELQAQGLVRNIGVCNFTVARLQEAQASAKSKIVLDQVHYNLIFREPALKGVLEHCQKNDMFLEAWRPVQQGNLTKPGIEIVDKLGDKYGKTPSQIAINWLLSQSNVITLVKSSNPKHLAEDFGAVGWQLSDDDVESLRRQYPIQLDRSNAVQLL